MEENVLKFNLMEKFVIGESTAKVAELVLIADNLNKQMGLAFSYIYGEKQADEALKEFERAFEMLNRGLIKHLGTTLYESLVEVKEVEQ